MSWWWMPILAVWGAAPVGPEQPRPEPKLVVGEPAPRFLLKTMNPEASGVTLFSTKRYVGNKATEPKRAMLLTFGANHCAPCKKELPEIAALADRFGARGVMFGSVIVDAEEASREAMQRFMADDVGIRFPIMGDLFSVVGRRYGAEVLPLNVLVDDAGRVAWFAHGFHEDTVAKLEAALEARATPREAPSPPTPRPAP